MSMPKCHYCANVSATICENCEKPICYEHTDPNLFEDVGICQKCSKEAAKEMIDPDDIIIPEIE